MQRSYLHFAAAVLVLAAAPASLFGQWFDYPTPGVPKGPDGKPNLTASAPRTADGHPDLSGMWGWDASVPCANRCTDTGAAPEFLNVPATFKKSPPYQPWAAALVKERRA